MGLNSLRLRRTGIFYPTSGTVPSLGLLLNSVELTPDVIDDILEIEADAFARAAQGAWPDDLEHLLSAAKKAQLLTPALIRQVYFHVLRQGSLPKKCGKDEIGQLTEAYRDLMAQAHRGYPAVRFSRLLGLLVFGHFERINVDGQATPNFDAYKRRTSIALQCRKYSHIPGMLDKVDKFVPFADLDTCRRLLALLRASNYSEFDTPGALDATNLFLWGLVLIVLLHPDFREGAIADLKRIYPEGSTHLEILDRYVQAAPAIHAL
jgi:hypothetical protein